VRAAVRRATALAACALLLAGGAAAAAPQPAAPGPPAVVVATFDTGTNPFHPCFRRPGLDHPHRRTPAYPKASRPLRLPTRATFAQSLAASQPLLDDMEPETLYHVPGTNLSSYGGTSVGQDFVDDYPHGAQASSQIGCEQFGLAPDAQLVVLNWYDDDDRYALLRWVTEQSWIDVVHLNIQDLPTGLPDEGVADLVATGKLVVLAAGNGVAGLGASYPMELSAYNAPRGSLVAGANDNGGYTFFSNLNPHVVMDGMGTRAAAPDGYGEVTFSGTSSASPLITGYAARLLGDLRKRFGHTGSGLLTVPPGRMTPRTGPLQDGELTAEELHEVIRRTADPNPHESRFDGDDGVSVPYAAVPQPVDLPFSFYPKMGYGEVSEHTLPKAMAVLSGRARMPVRPHEDRFYAASEALRR
jgi:hypothetical protein